MAWPGFLFMALAASGLREQSAFLARLASCKPEWELDIQAGAG